MDSRFSVLNRWKGGLRCHPQVISGGFSEALVFRCESDDGLFALRGWPEDADPRRLNALHRLLKHIADADVPVAVPRPGVDGNRLQWHAKRWWQIEPWLPGTADFRHSPTDTKLNAAIAALAAFHHAATAYPVHSEDLEWLGGPAYAAAPTIIERRMLATRRLIGGEWNLVRARVPADDPGEFARLSHRVLRIVDRCGQRVHDELKDAESLPVPLLPVLRDIWHDHVLFTNDRVTGLIDASACRRDTVAADLSRLLGSMLGDDRLRWNSAIDAYRRLRPLTDNEYKLIPVLDRSGVLLSAVNWVRRRYLFDFKCDTPEVVARLRELVERLERMSIDSASL